MKLSREGGEEDLGGVGGKNIVKTFVQNVLIKETEDV